jgi:hypothetical protein
MPLFTKSNVIKMFAFFLVLVMVIEIPALYFRDSGLPEDNGQTTTPEENATQTLFGIAFANTTVSSYGSSFGSSITVVGNSSKLDEVVKGLKSDKLVSYQTNVKNGVVLNLAKGANMSAVVERLSPLNFTIYSQAELLFKDPVVFKTENGPLTLQLQGLKAEIDPSIPVGYKIGVKIMARIQGTSIIESQYIIVPMPTDFITTGETVKLLPEYSAIGILDWPDRSINKSQITDRLSERFSNVTVSTIINDTVAFSKPATIGSLVKIASMNLSYVRNVSLSQLFIYPNFTDNGTLENDVGQILASENITLVYPYSFVKIDFTTEQYSPDFLNSSLKSLDLFVYRNITMRISERVFDESQKPYRVMNRESSDLFLYKNETGGISILTIRADVVGNKVLNYTVTE